MERYETLETTLYDYSMDIEDCATPEDAITLSNELCDIAETIRGYRTMPRPTVTCDFFEALDDVLEHLEATALELAKESKKKAEVLVEAIEDEERYGSYQDQCWSEYRSGKL